MSKSMLRLALFAVAIAVLCVSTAVADDDGDLKFKKTVAFKLDKSFDLDAKVGPVSVDSVEFVNRGGGTTKSKAVDVLKRSGTPGTTTTLRCAFDVENPSKEEWEVTATLEFYDKDDELIDRVRSSRDFEGEADTWTVDHPTLGYVVPLIKEVKITLQAEYD